MTPLSEDKDERKGGARDLGSASFEDVWGPVGPRKNKETGEISLPPGDAARLLLGDRDSAPPMLRDEVHEFVFHLPGEVSATRVSRVHELREQAELSIEELSDRARLPVAILEAAEADEDVDDAHKAAIAAALGSMPLDLVWVAQRPSADIKHDRIGPEVVGTLPPAPGQRPKALIEEARDDERARTRNSKLDALSEKMRKAAVSLRMIEAQQKGQKLQDRVDRL